MKDKTKDKTGWNKYRRGPKIQPSSLPLSTGSHEITIDSLSSSGDGIGRLGGRAVFVPHTLPGDVVRVKLVRTKKTFAHAQLQEIITASDQRVVPECQYVGQCGGCQWQHIPYQQQLEAKHQNLLHILTHIGKLEKPIVHPVLASPELYHYRNRIQGEIVDGRFHFRHRKSDEAISVNQCVIADSVINEFLAQTDLRSCPQGRVEIASDKHVASVLPLNSQQSTELGFRQVNTPVNSLLNNILHEIVAGCQCSTLIDLYCGRGSWTISLAQHPALSQCVGVDSSADNIRLAKQAAKENEISNTRFIHAKVESTLKSLSLNDAVCIVDPPRAGLHTDVRRALCAPNAPQLLLYISCHPATLARDLAELTEKRYQFMSATPLDMFPQTPHLECLAQLSRL